MRLTVLPLRETRTVVGAQHLRRRVADRYAGALRRYARVKLRHDPVYAVVAAKLREASVPVLDIGCGIGLLGLYLRAHGFRAAYFGIDCDRGKIDEARRIGASEDPALAFALSDAAVLPDFSGAVVLLDMLHYLQREQQRELLREAAARTAAGAPLIIRTVLREPAWRYYATVCEERLLHGIGWMQMPARHYPRRSEIEATLHQSGLTAQIRPLWGTTPFASFLIVARRDG
jgi:2-polyprenyl-3-methyl-5-hydroxy-6-metoxy-1,4-benzoquinol methylase